VATAAIFHPAARDVIRGFPNDVRRSIGKAVWELQTGVKLRMPLCKAMPAVGAGVEELRIKDRRGAYRAFYYTRSARGIFWSFMPSKRRRGRRR